MRSITLFLFILLSSNSFCQEPPCSFKVTYASRTDAEEFLKEYEVSTAVYDGSDLENSFSLSQNVISDQAIYIYIPKPTISKGTLIGLHLKNKRSNKKMSIYIRIAQDMQISEKLELLNLIFTEGYYFYDLCNPDTAHKANFTTDNKSPKSISLAGILSYKTSLKKIAITLRKKSKC